MLARKPPIGVRTLSNKEAAARLGVSPSFLNKARQSGNGPVAYKYGRKVVYLAADIAAYAAAHRQAPSSQRTADAPQDQGGAA